MSRDTTGNQEAPAGDWSICNNHKFSASESTPANDRQYTQRGKPPIAGCSRWLVVRRCTTCSRTWFACCRCGWKSPIFGTNWRKSKRSMEDLMAPVASHSESTLHQDNLIAAIEHHVIVGETHEASTVPEANGADGICTGESADDNNGAFDSDHSSKDIAATGTNCEVDEADKALSADGMEQLKSSVDQSEIFTTRLLESVENPELRTHLQRERRERLLGVRSIATAAYSRDRDRELPPNAHLATVEGAHFATTCAELHMHMSVADRAKFNWVLRTIQHLNRAEWPTIMGPVEIPGSITEANRVFMTGTHSISNKQPVPMLSIVENRVDERKVEEMVVAEPKDILQFLFSVLSTEELKKMEIVHDKSDIGDPPEEVNTYFDSSSHKNDLKSVVDGLRENGVTITIVLVYKLWSDAWDPDGTKNNRNGIWSLVWTIMFGGKEYVFPVAVGSKGYDHHPVLRAFMSKIDAMGEYPIFHHMESGINVRVHLSFGLYNVDRLEKGELWGGQHHAALRCRCFRVVYGFSNGDHPCYPACEKCGKAIVSILCNLDNTSVESNKCPLCDTCACYVPAPTNGATSGPVPADILSAGMVDYDGVVPLAPVTLDYCFSGNPSACPSGRSFGPDATAYESVQVSQQFLVTAAQFITFQYWKGAFTTKGVFQSWTDACGIGRRLSDKLFKAADYHRKRGTTDFCDVFVPKLLPPTWLHPAFDILKFLDAPMHLLFLGIVSKVTDLLDEWFALHGLKSSFSEYVSKKCENVGKMSLQWLLLRKFGVTVLSRGSWVSEQYVAFSKYLLLPYAGLIYCQGVPKSQIRTVLRVLESCFCLLSFVMRRSVTEESIARSAIAVKVYLLAVDKLGAIIARSRSNKESAKRKRKQREAVAAIDLIVPNNPNATPLTNNNLVVAALETNVTGPATSETSQTCETASGGTDSTAARAATVPVSESVMADTSGDGTADNSGGAGSTVTGVSMPAVEGNAATALVPTVNTAATEIDMASSPESGDTPSTNNAAVTSAEEMATSLQNAGVPISLSNPNHASLPNILLSMASHGPPVDQWEGKEGGEKSIQDLKPFFRGVCVVDGGSMKAAFKNFYRSKVISETNIVLSKVSSLILQEDSKPRARYTDVNRYKSYGEIVAKIQRMDEISAFLYSTGPVGDSSYVICVAVRKSRSVQESLYVLELSDPVPFCDDPSMPFAHDLLTFVTIKMAAETVAHFDKEDMITRPRLVTKLAFLPGEHVWRDTQYSSKATFPTDKKYTVVSDDYRSLFLDKSVRLKTGIHESLWLDFDKDSNDIEDDESNNWMSYTGAELREEIDSRNKGRTKNGIPPRLLVSGTKRVLADRLQLDDEAALGTDSTVVMGDTGGSDSILGETHVHAASDNVWQGKTVQELKTEIKRRNVLKVSQGFKRILLTGNKRDLVGRLLADDDITPIITDDMASDVLPEI